ncbi:MAG: hypothetical protein AAB267_04110, partial [Candidatus Desantisbacteria bacterium]
MDDLCSQIRSYLREDAIKAQEEFDHFYILAKIVWEGYIVVGDRERLDLARGQADDALAALKQDANPGVAQFVREVESLPCSCAQVGSKQNCFEGENRDWFHSYEELRDEAIGAIKKITDDPSFERDIIKWKIGGFLHQLFKEVARYLESKGMPSLERVSQQCLHYVCELSFRLEEERIPHEIAFNKNLRHYWIEFGDLVYDPTAIQWQRLGYKESGPLLEWREKIEPTQLRDIYQEGVKLTLKEQAERMKLTTRFDESDLCWAEAIANTYSRWVKKIKSQVESKEVSLRELE